MKRVLLLIKGLGRGGAEQILASAAPHLDRDPLRLRGRVPAPVEGRAREGPGGRGRARALPRRVARCRLGEPAATARFGRTVRPGARALARGRVAARVALAVGGPPIVYTEHNEWERYHPLTYWGNMLTFGRNRHVFAVSDHVRASMRYPTALACRRMPPVETLYHGIDPSSIEAWASRNDVRQELGIAADAPVVGTVANFKSHKRLDQLIRAAALVRRCVPNVRFVLVGQGQLERELRHLAGSLDLDDTVVFTGFREDAPRVCSTFDVFTLSSEHEGLSIALIEALALGKPAVVTDVGGLPEVVEDGRQGYLVPTGAALDPGRSHRAAAEGSGAPFADGSRRPCSGRGLRHPAFRAADGAGLRGAPVVSRVAAGVDVRPYRDADEQAVLGLLNDALGGGPAGTRPAEFFRWKHLENPFGRSFMLVAEADGRIVGLRAFMRWEFVAGDRRFRAVRAVDTATHPDHQGKGIFSRLTLEALDSLRDQADFVFNTPNEKSLPGVPEDGLVRRRPRADPDPRPATDPVRDPGAVVALGERARAACRSSGAAQASELLDEQIDSLLVDAERPPRHRDAAGRDVPALAVRRRTAPGLPGADDWRPRSRRRARGLPGAPSRCARGGHRRRDDRATGRSACCGQAPSERGRFGQARSRRLQLPDGVLARHGRSSSRIDPRPRWHDLGREPAGSRPGPRSPRPAVVGTDRGRPGGLLMQSRRTFEAPAPPAVIVVIGLIVIGAFVSVAFLLIDRKSFDVWGGFLLAPVLIAVTIPALRRQAARETDPRMFRIMLIALLVKLAGAGVRYYVAFTVYGGAADAARYHSRASRSRRPSATSTSPVSTWSREHRSWARSPGRCTRSSGRRSWAASCSSRGWGSGDCSSSTGRSRSRCP